MGRAISCARITALLLSGAVALSGCKDKKKEPVSEPVAKVEKVEVALAAVEFPSFTLSLPAGTVSNPLSAPDVGRYEVQEPDGREGLVRVEWEPGARAVEDELRATMVWAAEVWGQVVHDESLTINGVPGLLAVVELASGKGAVSGAARGVDGGFLGLTLLQCPERAVRLTVVSWVRGSRDDNVTLSQRIASSVQCKARIPDDGDGAAEDPGAWITFPGFDPPPGFGYLRGSNPPAFLGTDETMYMFERSPVREPETFEKIRADLYRWSRAEGLTVADLDLWDTVHAGLGGTPMRVIMARLAASDGDRITLFLGHFDCQERGVSFRARYLAGPDIARKDGAARLAHAGCAGGVAPRDFPSVEQAFRQACYPDGRKGAKRRPSAHACKLLADLLEAGEVELPGADPETLYRRACKLGDPDAC